MGIAFILIGTILLFVLALKGYPVVIAAPLCALIVALGNGVDALDTYRTTYMGGAANMLITIFPIILLGSIIAEFYRAGGGATSIATALYNFSKKISKTGNTSVALTFIIINLMGLILAYGGINGVVVTVIIFPIALEMFKNANLPREIAPGVVLSGTITSALIMPGSPQLQNVLPMNLLGTTSTAGLVPGLVIGAMILIANIILLTVLTKNEIAKGNGFTTFDGMPNVAEDAKLPNPWLSLLPLVVVFALFNFAKLHVLVALFNGAILSALIFLPNYGGGKEIKPLSSKAVVDAGSLTLIVCALSAYGTVIAAMPSFSSISDALIGIPGPPLIKAAIAMMLVTAISGSGPAGIGTGVPMFASTFEAMGINMAALHRVAAFSGVSLDSLPSNAAVNVAARLSGYSVAKTYLYSFCTTVLTTSLGTLLVAILLTIFPGAA